MRFFPSTSIWTNHIRWFDIGLIHFHEGEDLQNLIHTAYFLFIFFQLFIEIFTAFWSKVLKNGNKDIVLGFVLYLSVHINTGYIIIFSVENDVAHVYMYMSQ